VRPLVSPVPAIAAGRGPFLVTGVSNDSSAFCAPPLADQPGLFNGIRQSNRGVDEDVVMRLPRQLA
jgi:hypothetical protein